MDYNGQQQSNQYNQYQNQNYQGFEQTGFDQNLYNQQNQFWNKQKSLNQDQIAALRDQENPNEYQQAIVKPAKFQLPSFCECFFSILQGGLFYLFLYFNIFANDPIIIARIMPGVFYIFLTCMKYGFSGPRMYLSQKTEMSKVQEYYQKMKTGLPIVQYSVEAYHRKTTGSGKNRRTKTVVTYKDTQQLVYTRCVGIYQDLSQLLQSTKNLRLVSILKCYKGNELAENNWKLLSQGMKVTASQRDTHHRGWDSSYVEGLTQYQMAMGDSQSFTCILNKNFLRLFYILGLSLFFDTLFYSLTGSCTFYINKTVYCELLNMDQMNNVMGQWQQVDVNNMMNPQNNPVFQQQNINNNQQQFNAQQNVVNPMTGFNQNVEMVQQQQQNQQQIYVGGNDPAPL